MSATLEAARANAATGETRLNEILNAVDHMLAVHDAWENDPKSPDVPSQALEEAILWAIEACTHGDIPANCRELCVVAMPRLAFEWEQYANGVERSRRPDGTPTARFWATFKAVVMARAGATSYIPKTIEPVKELLRQGVGHDQIAREIWGYNGKGPFLRADQSIDHVKILEEADKPGMHTAGWVHPVEARRARDHQNQLEHRLAAATRREEDQQETAVDRTSIEDFLIQGAEPAIIANVKAVPLDEVLAVQRRLQADGKLKSTEAPSGPPAPAAPVASSAPEDGADDFDALEYIAANCQTQGVPEIVAGLKDHGVKMTAKQVQKAIAEIPKSAE